MKNFLLIIAMLASFACTKEPVTAPNGGDGKTDVRIVGNPSLAASGSLCVKLSPEAANAVQQAQGLGAETPTRSGIAELDAVLEQIDAVGFERTFAYDPEWEALYSKTGINRWYVVRFDKEVSPEKAVELFSKQPGVTVVEYALKPEYRRRMNRGPARPFMDDVAAPLHATRATQSMNDPLLKYQWHYDNQGPTAQLNEPVAGADIDLIDAWTLCTGGEDIIVAVIDEPVYTEHPDLKANMWSHPSNPNEHGYNFWNRTEKLDWVSNAYNSDYQMWEYADHGSHVAGVIAAVNNNGKGVCGIAGGLNGSNGVKIMSCQIMGYSNKNVDYDDLAEIHAFEYALKNGAVIAQNSWGYDLSDKEWNSLSGYGQLRDAIETFIQGAGTKNANSPIKGGIVTFAAGNDGQYMKDAKTWPAAFSPVIAIGAMAWNYHPACYTNYGTWVDISAPGGDANAGPVSGEMAYGSVLSTILCDNTINYQDGRKSSSQYGYGYMDGTSMACPHVSGVAALGLAYASQLGKQFTAEEYAALLLSSVQGIDQYFTGTIIGDYGSRIQASNYKGKMGGGCISALKLLLAIKGTPALYVKTGTATTINFSEFFGGTNSKITLLNVTVAAADGTRIGLKSAPAISGMSATFDCSKEGTAFVTVQVKTGDTSFEREFAVVSRMNMADNGGWL